MILTKVFGSKSIIAKNTYHTWHDPPAAGGPHGIGGVPRGINGPPAGGPHGSCDVHCRRPSCDGGVRCRGGGG
jgi:hypothetical protein